MATSGHEKISPIFSWLSQFREWGPGAHRWRCLDIGAGVGVMGYLWRAFMDIHCLRLLPKEWRTELIGVEIFKEYDNPVWGYAYDHVLVGDAREIVPSLGVTKPYDFAFMCDVIEHFDKEEGRKLLEHVSKIVTGGIIVSFPSHKSASATRQTAHYGNEHEKHLSVWRREDFEDEYDILHSSQGNLLILRRPGMRSKAILEKELKRAEGFRAKWENQVDKLTEELKGGK